MSLSFPCDRSLDRGVGYPAERALLASGTADATPSEAGEGLSSLSPAAVPVRPCRGSSEGAVVPTVLAAAPSGDLPRTKNARRCDSCTMGFCCNARCDWCRCACTELEGPPEDNVGFGQAVAEGCAYFDPETDEEYVEPEWVETERALIREGAIATYEDVHASEYGSGSEQRWAL